MSILIKGKMPKKCFQCVAYDIGSTSCLLFSNGIPARYSLSAREKPDWCELVELPPHGRLIDADALLERFEKEEKAADEHGRDFSFSFKSGGENCTEWWPVQQMLMDAPTIIEAEEGE